MEGAGGRCSATQWLVTGAMQWFQAYYLMWGYSTLGCNANMRCSGFRLRNGNPMWGCSASCGLGYTIRLYARSLQAAGGTEALSGRKHKLRKHSVMPEYQAQAWGWEGTVTNRETGCWRLVQCIAVAPGLLPHVGVQYTT